VDILNSTDVFAKWHLIDIQ